jgi:hypothetical protein
MAPKNTAVAFSFWQAWLYHLIPNLEEVVDPSNPHHQIAVQSAIHEMAKLISDRAVRDGIQSTANKGIAVIAQKYAK